MSESQPKDRLLDNGAHQTEMEGPGHSRSSTGLHRFETGVENPWQRTEWNQESLLNYIREEQARTRQLFKMPLTADTVIDPALIGRPKANITFKDVSFAATRPDGSKITILEPVSGHLEAGELVAVMGPSGCGKSTLLDMLAGKKTSAYEGADRILVNGHKRDKLFQRISAYVGQEDVMPEYWKVKEAVDFNIMLKNPRNQNIPTEISSQYVDIILEAFGLGEVSNTYIGGPKVRGISGGQRRRVTLARGVAQRASILFADEPTSGLSATDAELCIKALRIIAKKMRVLVVVVIHQPRVEVADLFDRLILLTARPGRMVYNGKMRDALQHWADAGFPVPRYSNPTDVYLDNITPGGAQDQVDTFVSAFNSKLKPGIDSIVDEKSQDLGLSPEEILRVTHQQAEDALFRPAPLRMSPVAVPFCRQVPILYRRKIQLTLRNPASIIMPIGMPIFVGVLMGVMYQGIGKKPLMNQLSFVFMLLMRICMGGMQLMPSLIDERTIMKYDISERLYSVPTFIIVSTSVDILLSLLGAIANTVIMYMFSQMDWKYFGLILSWALVNFFVFDSFFGFLAAWAPTLQIAQVAAIPFNSIFMMFSGFMITKESSPPYLRWLFEISPIGYAIESIFTTMAEDYGMEGQQVVKQFGFQEGNELKGLSVMAAMFFVMRLLQVWALTFKNNIQK